ncbi:MAG: FAD-binding oxidoreductase [Pseudomonadota bacterium]
MPDDQRSPDPFYASLEQAAGADAVIRDEAARQLFSQDVFATATTVDCIVAPRSVEALAQVAATAKAAGRPMLPRGGGMSYTSGYIADDPRAVLVDTSQMNRILEINEEDMYVTVEAGCTWAQLYEALKPKGLRTPFWGPLSGLKSTIGGGLSQGNAFFGAGVWGTTTESLISLTVVLADGTIVKTGGSAAVKGGKPFYRHYGPDLTGLFTGDCGALGFKAEATFRLMRAPKAEGYASFSFETRDAAAAAMAEMAREAVGTEVYGFDPALMGVSMRRGNWSDDVKSLAGVVKGQKSVLAGVKEAAKIVTAGKGFAKDSGFTIHVSTEGRVQAAVDADLDAARQIAEDNGGSEIENSLPKVVRGTPFGPLNSMIGPEGQRWVPVHGLIAHSDAPKVWAAIDALFEEYAEAFKKHDVITGYLTTTLSTNAFLIEPVFLWPEELYPLHEVSVDPAFLKRITPHGSNPDVTALVTEVRERATRLFLEHGATHFQIGRTYLYKEGREDAAWRLLEAVKSAVDPDRRVNPGSLGLE